MSDPESEVVQLASGARITIRPLRPESDRQLEIEFLNGLSERTRYLRLLTPLRYLPRHLIDQFMDVDGRSRVAFVAVAEEGGRERFVGVVRYAVSDDPSRAELGVTVADDWHRQGIASALLRRLMKHARSCGIKTLFGLVLPENASMLELARHLGFDVTLSAREQLMKIERRLDD